MKLRISFISAAIGMAFLVQTTAQTILDFSTANADSWTVTAGGAVNAIPFVWSGNIIGLTSDGLREGTFVSGGSLANFDGFWTATFAFALPNGARSVSLNFSGLLADDRVVLELNGKPIAATGIFGPGQGNMVLTDGGTNGSYYFDDPASSVSRTVADGFNIGGHNALTAIINNTDSGIYGGPTSIANSYGDYTGFAVNGTISYTLSSEAATIAHVQVKQRSGMTLVDLFYDLSGNGSAYSVSVSVSCDSGASFTNPASHFTGDGVTRPTAPGTGLHMVWDAGADLDTGYFPNIVLRISSGASSARSSVFPVNLRGVGGGGVDGQRPGAGWRDRCIRARRSRPPWLQFNHFRCARPL